MLSTYVAVAALPLWLRQRRTGGERHALLGRRPRVEQFWASLRVARGAGVSVRTPRVTSSFSLSCVAEYLRVESSARISLASANACEAYSRLASWTLRTVLTARYAFSRYSRLAQILLRPQCWVCWSRSRRGKTIVRIFFLLVQ